MGQATHSSDCVVVASAKAFSAKYPGRQAARELPATAQLTAAALATAVHGMHVSETPIWLLLTGYLFPPPKHSQLVFQRCRSDTQTRRVQSHMVKRMDIGTMEAVPRSGS
eukprot:COSAG05_NODE_643_length_8130_cov_11.217781_1_plen_109_part_10